MFEILANIISSALLAGSVLAIAALGESVSQRAGVFNLGIEGTMALGAVTAVIAVAATGVPLIGVIAAIIVGAIVGVLFAGTTVVIGVNQVLAGLAFSFLGLGISGWVGADVAGQPAAADFSRIHIPFLSDLPFFGTALFSHHIMTYLAFLVLPVILHVVLFKTRLGLNIFAVGENPSAADVSGVSVVPVRILCVVYGSAMAALAGAYLTLVFVPTWSDGITAGRGWIAFALVVFAAYRPIRVALFAFLFGIVSGLGFFAQTWDLNIPSAVFAALPYLTALTVLILPAWNKRLNIGVGDRPAALGQIYHKEDR